MYKEILTQQFCIDFNCTEADLEKNYFGTATTNQRARYWARNKADIVCYNNLIYVRTEEEALTKELETHFKECKGEWFLETKNIKLLNQILQKFGLEIVRFAAFLIPKEEIQMQKKQALNFVLINQAEIITFKNDERIQEAFCYSGNDPDQFGLAYYEQEELIALCGANKNGEYTWEIGVEVFDQIHRNKGLATKLVRDATQVIQQESLDILPVYGTAFSHTRSINVAINAGFKYGWTEVIIGAVEGE